MDKRENVEEELGGNREKRQMGKCGRDKGANMEKGQRGNVEKEQRGK